jgi:hypothetical protein
VKLRKPQSWPTLGKIYLRPGSLSRCVLQFGLSGDAGQSSHSPRSSAICSVFRPKRRPHSDNTAPSRCCTKGLEVPSPRSSRRPPGKGARMRACDRRAESQETGTSQEGPVRLAVRRNPCSRAGAVSGARIKARRRGGLILLTMSTPAPALVITTPTEVGGALSMVTEAARDRGAAIAARRSRKGALPEAAARAALLRERHARARWPHTPTPRGWCWWRPRAPGAALAHTERTRRLVERAIFWSLRAGSDVPVPSPLTVRRIMADGTRLVRAHLRDARTAELTGELSDLCVVAAAPAATTADGHRHG